MARSISNMHRPVSSGAVPGRSRNWSSRWSGAGKASSRRLCWQADDAHRAGAGLLRGRLPAAESGGLFGLIEGLLLVVLAITGITGAAWLATQGSNDALAWREYHLYAARGFIVLLVLHVVTVSLHLIDFVRD